MTLSFFRSKIEATHKPEQHLWRKTSLWDEETPREEQHNIENTQKSAENISNFLGSSVQLQFF